MRTWLAQYGGYALILGGFLLFSTTLRSAAGPADVASSGVGPGVAPGGGLVTLGGLPWPGLRLIGNPRRPPPAGGVAVPTVAPLPTPAPPVVEPPATTEEVAAPPPLPTTERIVIPKIAVDAKVVDVGVRPTGEMETAAYAAGRLLYSAQAGEPGNAVIAGHNDIEGEVFRRLPELQVGDELALFRGDAEFRYRVAGRAIVREDGATQAQRRENARWMEPTEEPAVTLISCYPYRVDTHRIIVRAHLIA
jgi:sortase A